MKVHFKRPGRRYFYLSYEGWSNAAKFSSKEEAQTFHDRFGKGNYKICEGVEEPFDEIREIKVFKDKHIDENTRFSLLDRNIIFFQDITLSKLRGVYIENFSDPMLICHDV